ncbi:MAG: hypothetical protein ACXVDD_16115 [Polyangia bacterium]
MSSTGARCPECDDQADHCVRCGGRALAAMAGPAAVRGAHWAEGVVAQLVRRWPPRWPRSPRALVIASAKVSDLAPDSLDKRVRLARMCLEAAAQRYAELTDFLAGRRLRLPRAPAGDDDAPDEPGGPLTGEGALPK